MGEKGLIALAKIVFVIADTVFRAAATAGKEEIALLAVVGKACVFLPGKVLLAFAKSHFHQ